MSGDDVQNEVEEIIRELPDSKPELLEGIRRLRGIRQYERADRILEKAVAETPLPELRIQRGRVKLSMEDYRSAARIVEPLFSQEEPPAQAFAVIAHAKARLGEIAGARRFLEQAEQRGAVGRVVEEARRAIADHEPSSSEAAAPRGGGPEERTVQLSDDWGEMVRATAELPNDSAEEPGRSDGSEPEPPAEEPSDPAAEPTVELDQGTDLDGLDLDDSAGEQTSESFEVAPTDPDTNPDELFRHTAEGAEGPGSEADSVDLSTDEFDVDAIGPSAWDALYESFDDRGDSRSRPVNIEPIGERDDEKQEGIGASDGQRPRPVPTGGVGEKTENLDRSDLEERVKRRTPPELIDSESEGERLVDLDDSSDGDRNEPKTEPEVPSAHSDSEGWEPGDVLRPGADTEESEQESEQPDEEESSPRAAPTPDSSESSGQLIAGAFSGRRWGRIAGVTIAALLVGFIAAAVGARTYVQGDTSALRNKLEDLAELQARDTYRAWSRTSEGASAALESHDPTPTEETLEKFSAPLLSADPGELRRELRNKRIFAASLLEFRFEGCGKRNAEELANSAPNADSPRLRAAQVYRHLACNRPGAALESSEKAIEAHSGAAPVVDARLAALLETEEIGQLSKLVDSLPSADEAQSRYRTYLLARAHGHRNYSEADDRLVEIAESGETDHLDARIARVELAVERASADTALETAKSLLERVGEEASTYQRARLRSAAGRAHARSGNTESAREHFDRAIELSSARTAVYLPAIDFELDTASFERADELLATAEEKADRTPPLQVRRAEYLFQTGRYDRAAEALPEEGWTPVSSTLLRARLDLEHGRTEAALRKVEDIPADHVLDQRARALRSLAELRGEPSDAKAALETLDELRSQRPKDRHLTEISVRAHLAQSTRLDTSAGRDHLERALEESRVLAGHGSYAAVGQRLACRSQLALGALSDASEMCEKARAGSTNSVPAAVTSAEVALVRGTPSDAETFLDELRDELADTWPVAAIRIRAAAASREYSRARELLDTWSEYGERGDYLLLDGLLAFARGDYSRAEKRLAKAEQTTGFPDASGRARLFLAQAMTRTGAYEEAKSLIEEVNDLYRYKRWGWVVFGELRRQQDAHWDALENLRIAKSIGDFPPVRPDRERNSYLYTELALAWRGLKSWNHRRVRKLFDRASEVGGEAYPGYLFARGEYLGYRWNPDKEAALESVRRGLEAQPNRCDMVDRLDALHDKFDVPSSRQSIPDAAREACRSDEDDSNEE